MMRPSTTQNHSEPTRESLAAVIRAFLNSEITAFEFDEQLDVFRNSQDSIIDFVADAVWYHYDDCNDHLVHMSKQEWDYFQRLLLLLETDCTIERESRRMWSFRQTIAFASLAVFTYFAMQMGWGQHLLVLSVPFGAISMLIAYTRRSPSPPSDPYWPIIFPFATFSDLERAYHSTEFRKTQYPKTISSRTIRSPSVTWVYHLEFHVMWLLLAPIPLFVQSFPHTDTKIQARVA